MITERKNFQVGDKVDFEIYELYSDKFILRSGTVVKIDIYHYSRTIIIFVKPDDKTGISLPDDGLLRFYPHELKENI